MRTIYRRATPIFAFLLAQACYPMHAVTKPTATGARLRVEFDPSRQVVITRLNAPDTAVTAVVLTGRLVEMHGDTMVIALSAVRPEVGRIFYTAEKLDATRVGPGSDTSVLEAHLSRRRTTFAILGATWVVWGILFAIGLGAPS